MVIPVWLEDVMTLLLWFCSLVMTGLLVAAWREGRDAAPDRWWSYPVTPPVSEAADEGALMRSNNRPVLQTGVAILALSLALDVSASPSSWFSLEPEATPSVASASAGLLDFTESRYIGPDGVWSAPSSASDGWFV